jgi:hypothetical protein
MNLSPQLYYQLVYTLTDLLPPPLDDTPAALRARNHAAIAKVAAMLPVNANEADLAAQCIVARAQAEDAMRLIRENRHDIALTTRLNAQYISMVRTSLAVEKLLMQVQAIRRKREAIEATATQDARTLRIVELSMLRVADPEFERLRASPAIAARGEASAIAARGEASAIAARGEASATAAREEASPTAARGEASPAAAPTPHANPTIMENVSENDINSHDVAFETWLSEQPWNQGPETALRQHLRQVMTEVHLAGRESPANGRENPGEIG